MVADFRPGTKLRLKLRLEDFGIDPPPASWFTGQNGVEAGAVLVTPPGALRGSNNVKALFHLAGLQGEPGYGYQPVRDYPNCLRRALREVERYNLFVLEVVGAWIDRSVPGPRTLHHQGRGRFMVAGRTLRLPSKMK